VRPQACRFDGSRSLDRNDGDEVLEVEAGRMRLSKLFSKEQRAFYREHAPSDIALDSLTLLGPSFALKATFTPKRLKRKTVLELWLYPDGTRLLELSTKCAPAEGPSVSAEFRSYLSEHGVTITSDQQAKTKTALEFYASQIRAKAEQTVPG
jgi:hypothetical protein